MIQLFTTLINVHVHYILIPVHAHVFCVVYSTCNSFVKAHVFICKSCSTPQPDPCEVVVTMVTNSGRVCSVTHTYMLYYHDNCMEYVFIVRVRV